MKCLWSHAARGPIRAATAPALAAIRSFRGSFIKACDVEVDAMAFDDGWDDLKTLWQ